MLYILLSGFHLVISLTTSLCQLVAASLAPYKFIFSAPTKSSLSSSSVGLSHGSSTHTNLVALASGNALAASVIITTLVCLR